MKLLFLFVLGRFQSVENDMYRFFRCPKMVLLYIQIIVYIRSGDSNHLDRKHLGEKTLAFLQQPYFESTNACFD